MFPLPQSSSLGDLRITEIYAEHDFPAMFVAADEHSRLYLATWVKEDSDSLTWLYASLRSSDLALIRSRLRSTRSPFTASDAHLFRVTVFRDGRRAVVLPVAVNAIDRAELPDDDAYVEPEFAQFLDDEATAEFRKSEDDAEIVIKGDPVEGTAVRAEFFGPFVAALQSLANAIQQAVMQVPTELGKIHNQILTEARLLVQSEFRPGSFTIRLRLPRLPQGLLEGTSISIVERVADLLSEPLPGRNGMMASSRRLRSHYTTMLSLLSEQGAQIGLRTHGNPQGARLTARDARDRLREITEEVEAPIRVTGTLRGGDVGTGSFSLSTKSGTYRGKASAEARHLLEGVPLKSEVELTIRESVSRKPLGDVKKSYTMIDLRRIDGAAASTPPSPPAQAD